MQEPWPERYWHTYRSSKKLNTRSEYTFQHPETSCTHCKGAPMKGSGEQRGGEFTSIHLQLRDLGDPGEECCPGELRSASSAQTSIFTCSCSRRASRRRASGSGRGEGHEAHSNERADVSGKSTIHSLAPLHNSQAFALSAGSRTGNHSNLVLARRLSRLARG